MKAHGKTRTGLAVGRACRLGHVAGNLRSQSGQSLLEVALLTPLLLTLLLGSIELGRYAYISILVGNAARAGAAYGAESLGRSADTAGITAAADNDFQNNGQNVSSLAVSSSTSCGCDSNGSITPAICSTALNSTAGTCTSGHWVVMVSVTASGTFNSLFNYPGIPTSVTVSNTATLRVAQV
jgi:Flp pilus assembly protein TadG